MTTSLADRFRQMRQDLADHGVQDVWVGSEDRRCSRLPNEDGRSSRKSRGRWCRPPKLRGPSLLLTPRHSKRRAPDVEPRNVARLQDPPAVSLPAQPALGGGRASPTIGTDSRGARLELLGGLRPPAAWNVPTPLAYWCQAGQTQRQRQTQEQRRGQGRSCVGLSQHARRIMPFILHSGRLAGGVEDGHR